MARPDGIAGRKLYTADEMGWVDIPVGELMGDSGLDVYPEVVGKDYFRIHLRDTRLAFQAGGFIGLLPINERIAVDVRPRFPVRSLERLLRVAEHAPASLFPHLRLYETDKDSAPSLMNLLADAFLASLDEIALRGLYREYLHATHDTSYPRGRVLLGPTLQHHWPRGEFHRVATSWFEASMDTGPNRCLKFVLWYLAQHYIQLPRIKASARIRGALNRAYPMFDGVALDLRRDFLDHPMVNDPSTFPPTKWYYENATRLALTILRDRGVKFGKRGDEILMASLLIDLGEVFEKYVRKVLMSHLATGDGSLQVLDGNKRVPGAAKLLFDAPPSEDATPDIIVRHFNSDGTPISCTILEVKYKDSASKPQASDIYQAISYGASYRAQNAILVYPRNGHAPSGLHLLGNLGTTRISRYVFDLAASDIEDEEAAFVAAVDQLIISQR